MSPVQLGIFLFLFLAGTSLCLDLTLSNSDSYAQLTESSPLSAFKMSFNIKSNSTNGQIFRMTFDSAARVDDHLILSASKKHDKIVIHLSGTKNRKAEEYELTYSHNKYTVTLDKSYFAFTTNGQTPTENYLHDADTYYLANSYNVRTEIGKERIADDTNSVIGCLSIKMSFVQLVLTGRKDGVTEGCEGADIPRIVTPTATTSTAAPVRSTTKLLNDSPGGADGETALLVTTPEPVGEGVPDHVTSVTSKSTARCILVFLLLSLLFLIFGIYSEMCFI